jgi:hypothetical protein
MGARTLYITCERTLLVPKQSRVILQVLSLSIHFVLLILDERKTFSCDVLDFFRPLNRNFTDRLYILSFVYSI